MNLKKLFKRTPMPQYNTFNSSLKERLFSESTQTVRKSWLWTLFPSSGAVALAALLLFLSSNFQGGSVALADAISNTIQFTPSDELIERTVNIQQSAGVGAAPSHVFCYQDGPDGIIEGSCYLENFTEKNTWWLYQKNARIDTTRIIDGMSQKLSTLISDYDHIQCSLDTAQSAQGSCEDMNQTVNSYLKPFVNEGNFTVSNLQIKPVDADGDAGYVLITFESDVPLSSPGALLSTGPSGYPAAGYPGRAWVDENGKFQNEIIYLYIEELKFNASHAFYPNDSEKTYLQIWDVDGSALSNIYLLNVDDYTLTPASDAELEESQKNYRELSGQFAVSTERMDQDYELVFSSVSYLQEHLSELEELGKSSEGNLETLNYSVPADLGLYGGTNNALITEVSFTIDQETKRIAEYSFYDADGTVVEHVEIAQSYPSVDPESLFTKEAWLMSL